MERFSQRESVLLGYGPRRSFMNDSSSPDSSYRNSDIDFNDVFGGPPRRSSIHEMRLSYSEATNNSVFTGRDETVGSRNSLNGLSEKPVFGEEGLNRRRYQGENFYDDIFRGNESLSSSPRKRDWDPYSSSPGSRVLSPARPLPPKAEPFGSSLPAQFSLPAKLTKGLELPTFGSAHRSLYKNKDGASDGVNYYSSPLSRTSSLNNEGNDARCSHRQSLLSRELSLSSKESLNFSHYDDTDTGGDSKRESNSSEVLTNDGQFHFSIYKWASKGVPSLALAMPLRGGISSRLKKNTGIDRCSGPDAQGRELPAETLHDAKLPSDDRISSNTKFFTINQNKQENGSRPVTSTQDRVETCQNAISKSPGEETKSYSHSEIRLPDKLDKNISVAAEEAHQSELKRMPSLFYDNDNEQCKEEIIGKASGKKSTVIITKKPSAALDSSKSVKKQDGKRSISDNAEVDKASLQGSTLNSLELGKIRVKGKVKEFVKIFNQEALSKPKPSVESPIQSSRWKEISITKAAKEANFSNSGTEQKIHRPNGHIKKSVPDAPILVDEYLQHSENQHSSTKNTNVSHCISGLKDSSNASMTNGSKVVVGDPDDSFRENFQVKVLIQDENELPEAGNDPEDIQVVQAIETKIRQWSNGKEGNIRSLLSTLQYVLWPNSGWKPVPLVDIIDGNAVKRSYQKALLCLHPDKLQQKGAASHQRYIAEKVFDILQDAWTRFNSLDSL